MKYLRPINEDQKTEYLLIVHTESSDEIHFSVIEYSFYKEIDTILNEITNHKYDNIEKMLKLIYDNRVADLMCQTYVLENYSDINKYNIIKAINIPELGA